MTKVKTCFQWLNKKLTVTECYSAFNECIFNIYWCFFVSFIINSYIFKKNIINSYSIEYTDCVL